MTSKLTIQPTSPPIQTPVTKTRITARQTDTAARAPTTKRPGGNATGNGIGGTTLRQKAIRTSSTQTPERQGNGDSKSMAGDGYASPKLASTPKARASKCAKSTPVSPSTSLGDAASTPPRVTNQAADLYDTSPPNKEESGENSALTSSSHESVHRCARSLSGSVSPMTVPEVLPAKSQFLDPRLRGLKEG